MVETIADGPATEVERNQAFVFFGASKLGLGVAANTSCFI